MSELQIPPGSGIVGRLRFACNALLMVFGTLSAKLGYRPRLTPRYRAVLDELMTADLLFNVGGGNINSITTSEIYCKLFMHWSRALPFIASHSIGQTLGPFYGRFDRKLAGNILNRVQLISFRDRAESQQLCKELGIERPVLFDAADDAITLPDAGREIRKRELSELGVFEMDGKLLCCMNMKASLRVFKGKGRTTGLAKEIELLAGIADRMVERFDAKIFFCRLIIPKAWTIVNRIGKLWA